MYLRKKLKLVIFRGGCNSARKTVIFKQPQTIMILQKVIDKSVLILTLKHSKTSKMRNRQVF